MKNHYIKTTALMLGLSLFSVLLMVAAEQQTKVKSEFIELFEEMNPVQKPTPISASELTQEAGAEAASAGEEEKPARILEQQSEEEQETTKQEQASRTETAKQYLTSLLTTGRQALFGKQTGEQTPQAMQALQTTKHNNKELSAKLNEYIETVLATALLNELDNLAAMEQQKTHYGRGWTGWMKSSKAIKKDEASEVLKRIGNNLKATLTSESFVNRIINNLMPETAPFELEEYKEDLATIGQNLLELALRSNEKLTENNLLKTLHNFITKAQEVIKTGSEGLATKYKKNLATFRA